MLRRARVQEGDRVLVVGVGGGTSTAGFLLARALGAEVYATSTTQAKRDWAVGQGAAGTFDSGGSYDEEVRDVTDGRGVDVGPPPDARSTFTCPRCSGASWR